MPIIEREEFLSGLAGSSRLLDNTAKVINAARVRAEITGVMGFMAHTRPAETFGLRRSLHGSAILSNTLTAWNDAVEWCASTAGGTVQFGPGVYTTPTTVNLLPYTTFIGSGRESTLIKQTDVPTSAGGAYAHVFNSPGDSAAIAFCTFAHLAIDGGWSSLRNYEGDAAPLWGYTPANMTQAGIKLNGGSTGASGGPQHSGIRQGTTDPYFTLINVRFQNVAGWGLWMLGRGENQVHYCHAEKCAIGGFRIDTLDSFFSSLSGRIMGDWGMQLSNGNHRVVNSKMWFCGRQKYAEPTGAGFWMLGAGIRNINMAACTSQDTWGPGIIVEGHGHNLVGCGVDEPAGGRIAGEGVNGSHWMSGNGGPNGSGGQIRAQHYGAIELRAAKCCYVQANLAGGLQAQRPVDWPSYPNPVAVHIGSTSADGNRLVLNRDDGVTTTSITDTVSIISGAGYNNAKRHNEIWSNGKLIHGARSSAQLLDSAHQVNNTNYGPTEVRMDDGRIATKVGGVWSATTLTSIGSPA